VLDFNLIEFFASYAYQPNLVYGFIVLFMTASSFGLPIPEEMTLVSAGLVAFMAAHPGQYPPPFPGAEGVNLITLSIVCFIAVLGSDLLIYFLGKTFGRRIVHSKFFIKKIGTGRLDKINALFQKYSFWACGIFRFTPGVRFPGHLSCGILGVPLWKFILVDGVAALFSVPTQVYLVATYGEVILEKIKEFKLILLGLIVLLIVVWLVRKFIFKKKNTIVEINVKGNTDETI
jgi:membrane protein DedA with SNARE-associated domain